MKIYSFPRGGLVFDDPFVPDRESSSVAFLPGLSVIPMIQHAGNRAYPVVSVGDHVREGMLVGRSQGMGSANVHATVPGRIVRSVSWQMADGNRNDALVIKLEGAFERLGCREELFPWEGLSPFELQRIIADYGIVEMEGPGRPVSDLIYSFRSEGGPSSLVARCVFDDPWLAADYVLCRERMKAVVEGSIIAARAGRAGRIVFAVSHKEESLGREMADAAGASGLAVSVVPVSSRYPQRNKRELEIALREFEKKESLELGKLLFLGPAALAAVHDAVKLKKPILERYVAIGGSALRHPKVMRVRIGTRIGELFDECGGFIDKPKRIATGSPLLGRSVVDLDEPVVKTTYAVFALLEKQSGGTVMRNCIGCGDCRSVCPVGLDPEVLYKATTAAENAGTFFSQAQHCHGCGCCEVVCPSRLPLSTSIYRLSKRG
ncbi:SLBB domain-containing protein [Treponema sp. OttesenSCG-928-L16]|nr:SLBB domain-containing protein [Treponema sp. OttesenSCG-928-L16]